MPIEANALENKEIAAIRGRHLLIFSVVCPALLLLAVYSVRSQLGLASLLPLLAAFFSAGFLAVLVAVAPLGRGAGEALGFRRVSWRPVVLGVVGTLVVSLAVSQLGIEPKGVKEALRVSRDPANLLASLAVMAILAPVVEELVFRGLLYGWLENRWNSGVAFIASSLAFAAAHAEPAHIVLVLPLGLLFGWLRRKTNSLVPSLIAHIANNGLAVVAAAFVAG